MVLVRSQDHRAGFRAGLAVGALGLALLASAFALEIHAVQGAQVPAGMHHQVQGPTHLVGAVDPGVDSRQTATCTLSGDATRNTLRVRVRHEAFEAIRVGTMVRAERPATLLCDHRVIVANGPALNAYPLASNAFLYPTYAVIALLGFAYARRRARDSQLTASPLRPGDDGNRVEMRRFAVNVVSRSVGAAAGAALTILGVVAVLILMDNSPAGLLVPAVVVLVAIVGYGVKRRSGAKARAS